MEIKIVRLTNGCARVSCGSYSGHYESTDRALDWVSVFSCGGVEASGEKPMIIIEDDE